jgi:hypothetical protein
MEPDGIIIIVWMVSIAVGILIGNGKHRAFSGFVWSLLFGPLGWLITICLKDLGRRCCYCDEVVQQNASICPHCHSSI